MLWPEEAHAVMSERGHDQNFNLFIIIIFFFVVGVGELRFLSHKKNNNITINGKKKLGKKKMKTVTKEEKEKTL